ncbi:MAG TPA: choice-of-anchor tandem repeat GloVer-containing protein [Terriglobales bacterium]|nr:choice-of-anchor tandem repeat GloVer-containing protein [Terriglobales bacterium]
MLRKPYIFAALVALALAPAASAQWNEEVLYSFQGIPDGIGPIGRIVHDKQGNLYGATVDGGAANCQGTAQCGTVYELTPPAKNGDPWAEVVLHVFQPIDTGDGAAPGGGLVMDGAGNLYGVTGYQGTGQCELFGSVDGCGTVYEMSPPSQPGGAWTEAVIYNFQGGKDGYVPNGDLVFDKAGNLYGVTLFGGGRGTTCDAFYGGNCGTWTEKVLYSFAGAGPWSVNGDGGQPIGGLVFDAKGNIYGTTFYGGDSAGICESRAGCGTAFELLAPRRNSDRWTEKVLHRFQGQPNDGVGPNGNLILVDGALYGTTVGGGAPENGTIFQLQLTPGGDGDWTEAIIHVFGGGEEGDGTSPLLSGPNLTFYGTAGGSNPGDGGAIYQLQPPGQEGGQWIYSEDYTFPPFGSQNAYDPQDLGFVNGGSGMYGSSLYGGSSQNCGDSGCGTVWGVRP